MATYNKRGYKAPKPEEAKVDNDFEDSKNDLVLNYISDISNKKYSSILLDKIAIHAFFLSADFI